MNLRPKIGKNVDQVGSSGESGGGLSTASNGLTVATTDVKLGGTLTENTSITGSYNFSLTSNVISLQADNSGGPEAFIYLDNVNFQAGTTIRYWYGSTTSMAFMNPSGSLTLPDIDGIVVAGNSTATYISFWDTNNSITGDSSFKWDNTDKELLIGTATSLATSWSTYGISSNSFYQVNIQNTNAGASASSDFVATANNGNQTINYIDLGINSSGFSDAAFTLFTANSGYLYINGGALNLGTQTAHDINFHTGGTLLANNRGGISSTGVWTINTSVIGTSTMTLWNTVSTTINAFGAATTMTVGGTPTTAITHNYSTNATATATTKTINIGTLGASGSTTNINVGSSVAGSTGLFLHSTPTRISIPVRTSTSTRLFQVLSPLDTTLTASTESILIQFGGDTSQATVVRQFATGALALQRENVFVGPTYSSVAASTITDAITVDIGAPIAGTNVTITNNYAARFASGLRFTSASGQLSFANNALIQVPTSNTFTLQQSGSNRYDIAITTGNHTFANATASSGTTAFMRFTQTANTGGSAGGLLFTSGAHTTQTLSTEVTDINFNLARTVQWATGALALQRAVLFQGQTCAFVGASTITDLVNVEIGTPVAGTNATVTRNWASRILGNVLITGNTYHGATGVAPTAVVHLKAGTATAGTSPLKLTSGTNMTTAEDGAIEYNGTNYFGSVGSVRYTLAKTLTASATLDFPSTAAQSQSDLTITVTGAADGDAVTVGAPNGSYDTNIVYVAWVSAADTVTVRLLNNALVAKDPASGTFKVVVIKF